MNKLCEEDMCGTKSTRKKRIRIQSSVGWENLKTFCTRMQLQRENWMRLQRETEWDYREKTKWDCRRIHTESALKIYHRKLWRYPSSSWKEREKRMQGRFAETERTLQTCTKGWAELGVVFPSLSTTPVCVNAAWQMTTFFIIVIIPLLLLQCNPCEHFTFSADSSLEWCSLLKESTELGFL